MRTASRRPRRRTPHSIRIAYRNQRMSAIRQAYIEATRPLARIPSPSARGAERGSRLDDTPDRHGRTSSPRALSAEDTPGHRPDDPGVAPDIFLLCTDELGIEVSQRSVEQALLPDICSLAFDALFDTALNPQVR